MNNIFNSAPYLLLAQEKVESGIIKLMMINGK